MGIQPRNQAEREIGLAMQLAYRAVEQMQMRFPRLPMTAISVGLINCGTQISVKHTEIEAVATYLEDVAKIVRDLGNLEGCDGMSMPERLARLSAMRAIEPEGRG